MEDLYAIFILMAVAWVIFYLGMRLERSIHNAHDPYINSVNAEANRRIATRKARRKIKSWKDI